MELEFHIERLNRLLKSFYQLTGIRIVIFDINHQEIASFPNCNCDFCKVIQNNKYGYECCNKSNAKAFEHCLESDDLYIYNCHAGLIEAMINLKIDNTIVGFIMSYSRNYRLGIVLNSIGMGLSILWTIICVLSEME